MKRFIVSWLFILLMLSFSTFAFANVIVNENVTLTSIELEKMRIPADFPDELIDIIKGEELLSIDGILCDSARDISPQWSSVGGRQATHQYITASALYILSSDKGSTFFTSMNNNPYYNKIMEGSDQPDKETIFFEGHFYDPDTLENYMGSTSNTAKTNLIANYNEAVSRYKKGDLLGAMESLGKSLHYAQDLSAPHHAANITAIDLGSKHTQYENYVNINRANWYVPGFTLSSSIYTSAETTSVNSLGHNAAVFSKARISDANSGVESRYNNAASDTVPKAIEYSTLLLWKFCKDTGIK